MNLPSTKLDFEILEKKVTALTNLFLDPYSTPHYHPEVLKAWGKELLYTRKHQSSDYLKQFLGDTCYSYCCLGIYAEMMGAENACLLDNTSLVDYEDLNSNREKEDRVKTFFGLSTGISPQQSSCLEDFFVNLNDCDRLTFPQIGCILLRAIDRVEANG